MRVTTRLYEAACAPPSAAAYRQALPWLRDPRALPAMSTAIGVHDRRVAQGRRASPATPRPPRISAAAREFVGSAIVVAEFAALAWLILGALPR